MYVYFEVLCSQFQIFSIKSMGLFAAIVIPMGILDSLARNGSRDAEGAVI